MPRQKAEAQAELLPLEDQPTKGRKKLVEAEHTIKYSAPVPVTIEEPSEDTDFDLIDDDTAEQRPKQRRNSEREELRKKLAKSNVTPGSQLKLSIERYMHSEVVDGSGGMFAETEHCTKYVCAESHITSEDYIDVARRYGPGLYRFTLRMKNQIVTAWDKRISATPSGPVIQNINPNDPNSPQVIVSSNGDGQTQQAYQPMTMKEMIKSQTDALKAELELRRLLMESYSMVPGRQAPQEARSEEEILSSAILKQPEVIENVVGSVIKRFGGASAKDDEPWYADVVRDAVKSGQLVQVVQVAIDRIFNGFGNLFPGRQDNGSAPMAPQAVQDQAQPTDQQQGQLVPGQEMEQVETAARASGGVAGDVHQHSPPQTVAPEDQALAMLIEHCRRNIPVKIAFDRLIAYADAINDQAPHLSIDEYISMFATMPIETAIEFVKTQPNGEQVVLLDHAKAWTETLQTLIKEAGQEGEE